MTNSELKKLAKEKINLGKTRQQALTELITETKKSEIEIAKTVRFIPTLAARDKFKTVNTILGIILVISIFVKLFMAYSMYHELGLLTLIFPIINILLAIEVFRFSGSIYRIVILFSLMSIINGLPRSGDFNLAILNINLTIIATLILLSAYLGSKLVSNFEKKKEWVTNTDGKSVMVDKFYFNEAV